MGKSVADIYDKLYGNKTYQNLHPYLMEKIIKVDIADNWDKQPANRDETILIYNQAESFCKKAQEKEYIPFKLQIEMAKLDKNLENATMDFAHYLDNTSKYITTKSIYELQKMELQVVKSKVPNQQDDFKPRINGLKWLVRFCKDLTR